VVAIDLVMPGKEGIEMTLAKRFTGQEILAAINQVLGS